jgi:protein-disulfide isomerase
MLFVLALPCHAQEDRLNRIEKELAEIKKEVAAIRRMLLRANQDQSAPAQQEVSIGDGPIRGDPHATLTLIEFSDYQCPFCGKFFHQTLPQIDHEFIQTGKLRYVIRELPLATIHRNAEKAAEAAQCAGVQGKYWLMHDKLFQNQHALEVPHLKEYAKEIGLDSRAFDECLDTGQQAAKVQGDVLEAQGLGVKGTPNFFLGITTPGKTIQGINIRGAVPIYEFRQQINRMLNQATQPASPQ